MNLIIDIGNSATKLTYFEENNIVYNVTIFHHMIGNFSKLIDNHYNGKVTNVYIGSVKPSLTQQISDMVKAKLKVDVHVIQQRNVLTKIEGNGELDLSSLGLDLAAIVLYLSSTYRNAIIIMNGTVMVSVEVLDGKVYNIWMAPGQYSMKKAIINDAELIEQEDNLIINSALDSSMNSTQMAIANGIELIQTAFIKEFESSFPKHTLIYSGPKNISLPERTIIKDNLTSIAYNYITSKKIM